MAGKQRIAILGGGLAGLATAFELTATPARRAKVDVTVHQVGWRLGGKCASSRGPHGRIEEHGLHVLLGAYENAFHVMRRVYAELDRPAHAPLARFEQAFLPHDEVVFVETIRGELRPWTIRFPRNDSSPGDGGLWPDVRDYVTMLGQWQRTGARILATEVLLRMRPSRLVHDGGRATRHLGKVALRMLRLTLREGLQPHTLRALLDTLRGALGALLEQDDALRRLWILLDLAVTTMLGIARDDLVRRGFAAVDDIDFRAWLRKHGASELAVESALVRAVYDLVFHAPRGQGDHTGFAAGTALRMTLRFVGGYKGAVGWWMAAGTGETLVAPLYEVLARRGVKFRFFERVTGLELDEQGAHLERIQIGVQATVRAEAYQPLEVHDGLPCWPATPDYDQLVEGEQLRASGADLESSWSGWHDVGQRTLQRGVDFDHAVLAISLAALPPISGELLEAHPRWRTMLRAMHTTPTIALQVWSHPSRAGREGKPMMNTGVSPLTGYGDMSHLLRWESWHPAHRPGHVLHVCNRIDSVMPPDASEVGHHERERQRGHDIALQWLGEDGGASVVPGATPDASPVAPDWSVLVDPEGRSGADRFEAQYWRMNVEPTDRYVLSVPGSSKYRLAADESGVSNLTLAGTWTRTGLDVGSVEAAILSGRAASRAICGEPEQLAGERDFR